ASTSGQIVPPVMGAAAFLIADFNRVSYWTVAQAAIIPAAMYLISVFLMVHLEALKLGLPAVGGSNRTWSILREGGHLLLPLAVIVYLLVQGKTPLYAAFYGVVATIPISYVRRSTRITPGKLWTALANGAKASIPIAMALICASLI